MRELFLSESGILGFGIWNIAQGKRNPNKDWNFSKAVVPTVGNLSSKVCHGVENFSLINFLNIFYFLLNTLWHITRTKAQTYLKDLVAQNVGLLPLLNTDFFVRKYGMITHSSTRTPHRY